MANALQETCKCKRFSRKQQLLCERTAKTVATKQSAENSILYNHHAMDSHHVICVSESKTNNKPSTEKTPFAK